MSTRREKTLVAGSVAGVLVVVLGALLVQHLRHGWPFSLHHGMAVKGAVVKTSAPSSEPAARAPRTVIELDPARLDAIGVRIGHARKEAIGEPLRAIATIVPDETRVSHVHTRVAGWIEELYVNTTGQSVRRGQPLAAIFSQELLSSQNEYLLAKRSQSQGPASAVLEASRARLRVLGMAEDDVRALDRDGVARRLVTVVAPRSGVVLHRGIAVGTAVDPSTELVTVADLSQVWVLAEIPEVSIAGIERGTPASIEFSAAGRAPFEARVAFVYPTLSERTRTLRVRFDAQNGDGKLRPGIYGSAVFSLAPREALVVPRDAVVDTGETQHVFVVEHEKHFVPRQVTLGVRLDDRIEVLSGLSPGEAVVASGVFLIDSESRLRASGGAGTGHVHGAGGDATGQSEPVPDTRTPRAPRKKASPPPAAAPVKPIDHSGHTGH